MSFIIGFALGIITLKIVQKNKKGILKFLKNTSYTLESIVNSER